MIMPDVPATPSDFQLPKQLQLHLKNATPDQLEIAKLVYDGKKDAPSFAEWLESYQHNKLFELNLANEERNTLFQTMYDEQAKKIENLKNDPETKPEELGKAMKELKRLDGLLCRSQDYLMNSIRELNKIVQTTLAREQPKKVDMTVTKVTPTDVAQMIRDARAESIDAEFEEIK